MSTNAIPVEAMPNRAYVTFLAGNGDYVKGVAGLAKGLRKAKSLYPLVVAILPDVPQEHRKILESQGCIVKEIEPVYPPENQTQFSMAYYVINYSKLRIWEVHICHSPYSRRKLFDIPKVILSPLTLIVCTLQRIKPFYRIFMRM